MYLRLSFGANVLNLILYGRLEDSNSATRDIFLLLRIICVYFPLPVAAVVSTCNVDKKWSLFPYFT